jgi:hypothetical protein
MSAPPTIAKAARAKVLPGGTAASLSVLAGDDGGESNLTYTWSPAGNAPGPVTFSANGTNPAKNAVAIFSRAGTYDLQVTATDADGGTATASARVTVRQVLTGIVVSPAAAAVPAGGTQQFTATALDQFGQNLATQPGFSWRVSGGGRIGRGGLFRAGAKAGGPFTVTAKGGKTKATATVTVG